MGVHRDNVSRYIEHIFAEFQEESIKNSYQLTKGVASVPTRKIADKLIGGVKKIEKRALFKVIQ